MTENTTSPSRSFRRRVIGVPSRGVVGGVEDLADARHQVADRFFDAHLQGHVGGAAALAAAAQTDVDIVLLDVDQLDVPSMRGHGGIDLTVEEVADGPLQIPLRGEALEVLRGDDWLSAADVLADDVADPKRRPVHGELAAVARGRGLAGDLDLVHGDLEYNFPSVSEMIDGGRATTRLSQLPQENGSTAGAPPLGARRRGDGRHHRRGHCLSAGRSLPVQALEKGAASGGGAGGLHARRGGASEGREVE